MASLKDRFLEGCVAQRRRPAAAAELWDENERSADYSFNKCARRLLRADLLPHGLPEGELPGRVHGGADLVRDGHEGQGPVLRRRVRRHGHRGAAARRQLVAARLRGRRGQDPVRAVGGQERRRERGRARSSRRAAPTARSSPSGSSASASTCSRCSSRVLDSLVGRRLRLHRRAAQGAARGRSSRRIASGRKSQADRLAGQGSIFDLEPVSDLPATTSYPAIPDDRVRQARAAAGRARHARAVRLEPPAGRRARPAAAQGRLRHPRARRRGARASAWSLAASSRRSAST